MMMSKIYFISFYILSIFLFINFTNPFFFWIIMEVNLLLFICFMIFFSEYKYKQEMNDLYLFYFILQSISSILVLSDFFMSGDFYMFNKDLCFLVAMLIKLGIFPFFYWIFKICDYLNFFSLSFLLSFQKVPFLLVLFSNSNFLIFSFLFGSFVFGSLMIIFSDCLSNMLVCSSISYSFWIFYLHLYSPFFFLFFFLFYSIMVLLFTKIYWTFSKSGFSLIFSILIFMFFIGLSPLSLFFFKFFVVSFLFMNFHFSELLLFWLFSFLTLFGYLKFFYKSISFKLDLFNTFMNVNLKMSFFMISILFFFLFII